MPAIAFIDTEVNPETKKILDLGAILDNGEKFHENSLQKFQKFIEKTDFICGHNVIEHDKKYLKNNDCKFENKTFIDTLFWSPILDPKELHHNLPKDEKLLDNESNNPLSDSIKAKNLFEYEKATFENSDKDLKNIFYFLLRNDIRFNGLFNFLGKENDIKISEDIIIGKIQNLEICKNAPLRELIKEHPIELAYCIALINAKEFNIIPLWVLENFPNTRMVLKKLRNIPCKEMCNYCSQKLNVKVGLKQFFGFENFREYAGEPLQEKAADFAVRGKSILAMFPTGGGKSLAFQIPALMAGENEGGLTVVISPLQSLMKDQVDNLEKNSITSAVTKCGLLDPIEMASSIKRVFEGSAHLFYIAPESLRSNRVENLLLNRNVVRFVIDEAHCLSAWGQDFRPDYLYIADFIKKLQEKKNCDNIPVSCFTATAKQKTIEDICNYFHEKLGLNLEVIKAKSFRDNITYKVIEKKAEDKYAELRNIIKNKNCPSIVYVSRTEKTEDLAKKLCEDLQINAKPFHGQLSKDIKNQNQNDFIQGLVQVIVATSAFGMGVDKKDVGLVVHYDISDSLENYLQEAGRAGRGENTKADCYILFDEADLDEHFSLLSRTKLSNKEITQIWSRAIKPLSEKRNKFQKSALEIARIAGWDDSQWDIETKIIKAINALEQSNYIKRKNNSPQVFANSMLRTMQDVSQKIDHSQKFIDDKQKESAKRIMSVLFSSKARQRTKKKAEERVDYIANILELDVGYVIEIVKILRDEKILDDAKDITVFMKRTAKSILDKFIELEKSLISKIDEHEKSFRIKDLNEQVNSDLMYIKTIFNFLDISRLIKRTVFGNRINVRAIKSKQELEKNLNDRVSISNFTLDFLKDIKENDSETKGKTFPILELRDAFNAKFKTKAEISDIENALLYLSKIGVLDIEDGFFVIYNKLTIEILDRNKRTYNKDDYKNLSRFYESKVMQIHIVGEYVKKMQNSEQDALDFANDYFNMNDKKFLDKYFDEERIEELKRNLSPRKYKEIMDDKLSSTQREIIDNKDNDCIVVTAGPGSGKTRVLVNKLAALLTMEDVKEEQLLMLTFSRAAATEFKERLLALIGKKAYFVEIKTFHSYCFDLLGKKGNIKDKNIIKTAVEKIKAGEIEPSLITKICLVIDEAQDMSKEDFDLINILKDKNEDMRIIAVGDDDQNIYETLRNSNSKYFASLLEKENCTKYELSVNYRSKANIVNFANNFAKNIKNRMKLNPIETHTKENGEIKIIECKDKDMIFGVVCNVLDTPHSGSTCILAFEEQEVWEIAGVLKTQGRDVEIIQSNDGFDLFDILEIRYFYDSLGDNAVVLEELWEKAKLEVNNKFKNTNGLKIAKRVIEKFEKVNKHIKYKNDFEIFVSEAELENFFSENQSNTIYVSTMHKAKGKEFDNVFIMLSDNNLYIKTDDDRDKNEKTRLLYVAMTRAKNLLHIHFYEHNIFGTMLKELGIKPVSNPNMNYGPVNIVPMLLMLKDVNLEYIRGYINDFESKQKKIENLGRDETLQQGDLFEFSKEFKKTIEKRKDKGYRIKDKEIKTHLIVYWKGKDMTEEIKIILPSVKFEKA